MFYLISASLSYSQHLSGNQHHPRCLIGRTNARGSRSEGIVALMNLQWASGAPVERFIVLTITEYQKPALCCSIMGTNVAGSCLAAFQRLHFASSIALVLVRSCQYLLVRLWAQEHLRVYLHLSPTTKCTSSHRVTIHSPKPRDSKAGPVQHLMHQHVPISSLRGGSNI